MRSPRATFFILGVCLSASALAQQGSVAAPEQINAPGEAAVQEQTPAQLRIAAARQQIASDPKKVQAYNELATAYLRRARETANPDYFNDADDALTEGLRLDSTDFQLQKTQVALMLGRHEFAQALERAKALNHHVPDDVMTYGYMAEAEIGLGNYSEAVTNAQWMMNMRPRNTPALLVGATLRTVYGDTHGAIDFLKMAYAQTSPAEVEELAWIDNQIASIQIESGQNDAAAQTLEAAEQTFSRYPYTKENLARVRMAQNRANDAVQLWMQAASMDKDPHELYELATAQEAAGQPADARATFAEFEKLASSPETATDNSRIDLILMYAASPESAPDALRLAQQEVAKRQDVWTLDAYAWALYDNGKFQEADAPVQKAISVGIQNAQIFDHAGHIAQQLNRSEDAVRDFKLSIQSNPASEFVVDAFQSVSLVAKADGRERNATRIEKEPDPAQTTRPNASEAPAKDPDRSAPSTVVGLTNGAYTFAPVPASLLTPAPTGTAHVIHSAQAVVARNPKDAAAYAGLGAAYFQRARESGDVSDYQLAEESLSKSLDLVSADFSADTALATMAEVCMGEHRFADALNYSLKALSLGTGDVSPFAIVGDAYADMGEYDKAAAAYGRLTPRDMTLGPRAAYARDSRLSYLKFIAGDMAAAIALMKTAVTEGAEAQLPSENLAWLSYELGEYETQVGDFASADTAYLAALNTHPGDYRALAALARLRANSGRYAEAIELYQKAIAVVPMPIFISELGDLYARTGNQPNAQKQFALVEYIGLLGHINQVLHNRDLALFYSDHDMKLTEALDLAQKELEVRHDIYTWDALAWALYKNGKLAEAAKASEKAMRFGTRDPLLLFHAGMIAERLGQREQARTELIQALQINPHFHLVYANEAKQKLAAIDAQAKATEDSNAHAR
ncbi:MAG: tetratricopeptide repeat protein [Terracidiphilus sp.]